MIRPADRAMLKYEHRSMKPTDSRHALVAVMVINDIPRRDFLTRLLERAGLKVCSFSNAAQAQAHMARQAPPALIVTELDLPDGEGRRFCRQLRTPVNPAFNAVPILVVSGTVSEIAPECIAADLGVKSSSGQATGRGKERPATRVRRLGRREFYKHTLQRIKTAQSETLQKKSEERRLLLDTIDTQIWYLSDFETYGAVNRAHAAFLGYHPRDIAYKKLEAVVSKDVAAMRKAVNAEVFQSGRAVQTEAWMPNGKDEPRLIRITRTPKLDQNGRVKFVVCAATDITKLRRSEERFRRIFENAPIGIAFHDRRGRLSMINRAAIDIFGIVDPEELAGFNLFSSPNVGEGKASALAKGQTISYERRFDFEQIRQADLFRTTKTGAIDVNVQIRPLGRTDTGCPSGYLVLTEDVSERNRLQRRLAQSEQQLRNIVEHSTNLFYTQTANGLLTYISPQVEDIFGYTPQQAMARWAELATDNPVNARGLESRQQAIDSGRAQPPYEMELRHKNERSVWVEIREAPVVENGRTVAIVGSCTDITARRQAEALLRASEARYRLLAQNIRDVIWVRDLELNLIYISPSIEVVLGYTPQEVMHRPLEEMLTAESAKRAAVLFDRMLEAKRAGDQAQQNYTAELEYRCKDGHTIWLEDRFSWSYDPCGNCTGILGVNRDITDRREMQKERLALERRVQQIQKTESLERMAAAIAHQFNNHLAGILGNLELAGEDLPPGTAAGDYLEEALAAARRATRIGEAMLTYLGHMPAAPEAINLAVHCQKLLSEWRFTLPPAIVLSADLAQPGPVVLAGAARVREVLTNILTNAREAIGCENGFIQVRLSTLSGFQIHEPHLFPIDFMPEAGRYACLEVTNSGGPISETEIDKLFDPFYTTKFIGRGLGLPVVLGAVEVDRGAVAVASNDGGRTIFRIFWPTDGEHGLK